MFTVSVMPVSVSSLSRVAVVSSSSVAFRCCCSLISLRQCCLLHCVLCTVKVNVKRNFERDRGGGGNQHFDVHRHIDLVENTQT